jgi:RHS repeat-associated protein
LPAAVSSAVYNADNQLTQWGSTTMTYDADGNTLNDGTNTYTWDARNHLISANNNGATFLYDSLGRRFGKTMLGANTNFLYDGLNPVQELNGTTPTANLLTGRLDERFTRTDATGTFSYLTDALGSTVALTDTTGNSDVQYSYDPYGSMSITGDGTNSYAYTGREFDGLGIDYYRARYYNPAIDRFISEDPIGLAAGTNEYAYVGDNSLNFTDPLGLDRGPGSGGPNGNPPSWNPPSWNPPSTPHNPPTISPLSRWACASFVANNEYSLASLTTEPNNVIVQGLLGNSISGVTDLWNSNSMSETVQDLAMNGVNPGIPGPAYSGGAYGVMTDAMIKGALANYTAEAGPGLAEALSSWVGLAKLGYDAATFGYAYFADCP